jgi:hypothetical protein
MEISFASISLITLASTIFGAGGFYMLTKFRQDKVEADVRQIQEHNQEVRDRLIRIETILLNRQSA